MHRPVAVRWPERVDPLLVVLSLVGLFAVLGLGLGDLGDAPRNGVFWVMMAAAQLAFTLTAVRLARAADRGTAQMWRWAAAAGGALVAGDAVQLVAWFRDPVAPGIVLGTSAQMALLGTAMVALLIGLLRYPLGITGSGAHARLRLDVATVMVGATTCGLCLLQVPPGRIDGGWVLGLVGALLLQPGLFLLTTFAVVRMVLTGRAPFTPVAALVLGAAAVAHAVLQAVPVSAYLSADQGSWLLAANVIASALLAVGARLQVLQSGADRPPPDRCTHRPYSLLPYGAMVSTWALGVGVLIADGLHWRAWVAIAGAMLTTALVIGRQVAAFRHIAELLRERDRLTARLTALAFHDSLTGLPNRSLFMTRLTDALNAGPVTVFLVDLDGFKPVNDAHGHATGDRLLAEVGARLRGVVRAGDTVARLGGDEFAVLIEGEAADRLPALASALHGVVRLGEHEVRLSASIGMAYGARDPDRLLHEADMRMYAMKRGSVAA
jgi:diguanylate cyclase (GGDEF)-like protein